MSSSAAFWNVIYLDEKNGPLSIGLAALLGLSLVEVEVAGLETLADRGFLAGDLLEEELVVEAAAVVVLSFLGRPRFPLVAG